MSIEQKFRRAGMQDIYDGVYRTISSYCHNNVTGLLGRHFKADQGLAQLALFAPSDEVNTRAMLQGAYSVCLTASHNIHARFGTGQEYLFKE